MIRLEFESTRPEDIEMQLTITMNISEWIELAEQVDDKYPAWELAKAIKQMVNHSNAHYAERVEIKQAED